MAMIQPLQEEHSNQTGSWLITPERLALFLSETHGKADILYNATELSKDHPAIVAALEMVYPHLDTKLKQRATRIIKKLRDPEKCNTPGGVLSSSEEG